MKLIEQRGRFDCGVAALAMLLNTDYEEAWAALDFRNPDDDRLNDGSRVGISIGEISLVLFERGILHYQAPLIVPSNLRHMDVWWAKSRLVSGEEVAGFSELATAAMVVNSKNGIDSGHWIVRHKGQVLDPSMRNRYDAREPIVVHAAILTGVS
jgi:hypothetical protein